MKNPSLRQEPRYEPASVIPLKRGESLLEWLEHNNRLVHRVQLEEEDEESEEELAALMGVDDKDFEEEDDDDDDDD
ncbi:MAG: DUF3134 domain-containing protein [Spirulinaceae cyanobacterium]